jgi:hypothetical protein
MKEEFTVKNFGSDALAMIKRINGILETYEAQGFDLSLRQLYYQLVAKALIENTEKSYKNIGKLVNDARMAGLIDWEMIKDRGREMTKNPHWENTRDFIESVAPQFRFNLWRDQDALRGGHGREAGPRRRSGAGLQIPRRAVHREQGLLVAERHV